MGREEDGSFIFHLVMIFIGSYQTFVYNSKNMYCSIKLYGNNKRNIYTRYQPISFYAQVINKSLIKLNEGIMHDIVIDMGYKVLKVGILLNGDDY